LVFGTPISDVEGRGTGKVHLIYPNLKPTHSLFLCIDWHSPSPIDKPPPDSEGFGAGHPGAFFFPGAASKKDEDEDHIKIEPTESTEKPKKSVELKKDEDEDMIEIPEPVTPIESAFNSRKRKRQEPVRFEPEKEKKTVTKKGAAAKKKGTSTKAPPKKRRKADQEIMDQDEKMEIEKPKKKANNKEEDTEEDIVIEEENGKKEKKKKVGEDVEMEEETDEKKPTKKVLKRGLVRRASVCHPPSPPIFQDTSFLFLVGV
jgi:hypothetical protein